MRNNAVLAENAADLPFAMVDELLWKVTPDTPPRLCVPRICTPDMLEHVHDANCYLGTARLTY